VRSNEIDDLQRNLDIGKSRGDVTESEEQSTLAERKAANTSLANQVHFTVQLVGHDAALYYSDSMAGQARDTLYQSDSGTTVTRTIGQQPIDNGEVAEGFNYSYMPLLPLPGSAPLSIPLLADVTPESSAVIGPGFSGKVTAVAPMMFRDGEAPSL
jgi:hypothetical protein